MSNVGSKTLNNAVLTALNKLCVFTRVTQYYHQKRFKKMLVESAVEADKFVVVQLTVPTCTVSSDCLMSVQMLNVQCNQPTY